MTYKPNGDDMINTGKLSDFARQSMYNFCLQGASFLMHGCWHLAHMKMVNKPIDAKVMIRSYHLSITPLKTVLSLLHANFTPFAGLTIHDDEAESLVIKLITMAADGINPQRTLPNDDELRELVLTVYAYATDRHAKYSVMMAIQIHDKENEA